MGTPVAFLIAAGALTAGLGIVGIVRHRPAITVALLAAMLVFADLPKTMTGLYPGEIERTWVFVHPYFAVAAALALIDLERTSRWIRRFGVPVAVAIGGGFAVFLQAMYDTIH
jgi:hypothetical protein